MGVSMIHTNAGLALLAKLEQGIPLKITQVCSGAGRSADLPNLIALTDQRQTLEITGQSQKGPQATIYVRLVNTGLSTGYDLTQIGVFAEDPDKGEILYRVAQFERALPMPAEKDFADYSFVFQIVDTISNASQVDVHIDPSGTSVVLSPARPTGDWTLWLKDLGEIPNYLFDDEADEVSAALVLNTAPLNAFGNFVLTDGLGDGETVTNMTDNPQTAKDGDIIITE